MPTNNQNIVILDVEEREGAVKENPILVYLNWIFKTRAPLDIRQKVMFFRMMATMVNANLTVLKSLSALKKQEKIKKVADFYQFMIDKIQGWLTMHESLIEYGGFNDAETSIIEAGEKTGKLNWALLQIAEQTEKVDSIRRKIKGAMTYPMVMIIGMIACVTVLMVKVIPTLTSLFQGKELPGATKAIMATSDFMIAYWLHIFLVLIALYGLFSFWRKTKNGKYIFDGIVLKMPIYGELLRKVILSRFARIFSNLISSGVSVIEAIRIVSSAVDNEMYRQRLLLLRQDVKNGLKMAESLEEDPLFPDLLVAMIRVGEETAQIGETVVKIATFYDEEVDIAIESIAKIIEPIIMGVMAIVIGFIAIGIFQPIMSLAGAIGGG
jgi:type IV pilus assembly protein PilC